ncbi:SGNH hydrolase-type esterase domain-containing protein [Aspergillus carlsbadensis]|nr:SGNH hydrolase-type esterase domain-containing protein [Aspergillus carlsbadensis]
MIQPIRSITLRTANPSLGKGQSLARRVATSSPTATSEESTLSKAKNASLRLMALGGSITYGIGSTDGNGYRRALYDMLVARGHAVEMVGSRHSGSMVNNSNEGWPGRRIDQIHFKAIKATARFLPNIFTINAGSNDCLQDFDIGSAGARIDAMLEDLWKAGSPDATVVLSTLVVAADTSVNDRVLRVNEQIRELVAKQRSAGKENIFLADMYCSAGGPQLAELVSDGIHPNDEGYIKMARIWAASIGEAVQAGVV